MYSILKNFIFVTTTLRESARPFLFSLLDRIDVRVFVVSEAKTEVVDAAGEIRNVEWRVVSNVLDAEQLVQAAKEIEEANSLKIAGILAVMEELQEPLAKAQSSLGLPGVDPCNVQAFRKKDIMQEAISALGFKTPMKRLVGNATDLQSVALDIQYPIVAKPRDGVGTRNTYVIENDKELSKIAGLLERTCGFPFVLEEYVQGVEGCLTVAFSRGELVWDALTVYRAGPLSVINDRDKTWSVTLSPCPGEPFYVEAVSTAKSLFPAMGYKTGVGFIEFFSNNDAQFIVSEVSIRPPSANFLKIISHAKGFDAYAHWAALFVDESGIDLKAGQAVAALYVRAKEKGVIQSLQGYQEMHIQYGSYVLEEDLPVQGESTSLSYEGEGCVIFGAKSVLEVEEVMDAAQALIKVDVTPAQP